jgi:hypothetical protein
MTVLRQAQIRHGMPRHGHYPPAPCRSGIGAALLATSGALVLVLLAYLTAQPRNPAAELASGRHRPRAPQLPRPGRRPPGGRAPRPAQATCLNAQPTKGDSHERTVPGPVHHG